jgi:hypothetical protein
MSVIGEVSSRDREIVSPRKQFQDKGKVFDLVHATESLVQDCK